MSPLFGGPSLMGVDEDDTDLHPTPHTRNDEGIEGIGGGIRTSDFSTHRRLPLSHLPT